ncbi:MAG: ketosteroid isomerase family protein [Burkholderiales bacterium]
MMQKPDDILKQWMHYVNTHNVAGLLSLYDEQAVLIPTFSNRLLNSPEKIREYFERLGGRDELSIALHEKTLISQAVKQDMHSLCGIYCWRFAIDGELFSFEARFSYLLNLAADKPILQHHSSQIPRMI